VIEAVLDRPPALRIVDHLKHADRVTARREGAAVCTIDQRLARLLGDMRVPTVDL